MRSFINIVESSELMESQQYTDMFAAIKGRLDDILYQLVSDENAEQPSSFRPHARRHVFYHDDIVRKITFAKQSLKRRDRITWYLRYVRIEITRWICENSYLQPRFQDLLDKYEKEYTRITNVPYVPKRDLAARDLEYTLQHYISLPIPKLQNLVWDKQDIVRLLNELQEIEHAWQQERKSFVRPQSGDEIVLDFGDGWAWFHLPRAACGAEGDAMGHCGNSPRHHTKDTIFSLRKKVEQGWKPYATFILDEDGYLTEMKGRFNNKPGTGETAEVAGLVRDKIVALLKLPIIKGISGGGYLPENNFELTDLDPELRGQLIKENPQLGTAADYLSERGIDDIFVAKLSKELRGIQARFNSISKDYVEVERWKTIPEFLRQSSGVPFFHLPLDLTDIAGGDFDAIPVIDFHYGLREYIKENSPLLVKKIEEKYHSISDLFESKKQLIDDYVGKTQKTVAHMVNNYLLSYIRHIPFVVEFLKFEILPNGEIVCLADTTRVANSLRSFSHTNAAHRILDELYFDALAMTTVYEDGWFAQHDHDDIFEYIKSPQEVLADLTTSVNRRMIKFISRLCD